ncbi:SUN domain-containing protein 2 [Quillaja saponaria]|uniref:SUN domain-containing protein 2 n=1 Tax=Quillaja saponaria TaxID=32244 RepID=A0AAD7LQE1_QUISA|nr:SUN domain-containing protein 2 [Quillaja saponaria]
MGRNVLLAVLCLFLVVADVSDASFVWWKQRMLVGAAPENNATAIPGTLSPSPVPVDKKLDPKPINESTEKKTDPVASDSATKMDSKGSNSTNSTSPSPTSKEAEKKENHEAEKKKDEEKDGSHSNSNETCDGLIPWCKDLNQMFACVGSYESESNEVTILVQNGGDSAKKVKLTVESNSRELEVPKHQSKKMNVSVTINKSTKLILDAGNGQCVLDMGLLVSYGKFFLRLPSYDKLITPVNGAYFLISAVLVFGGTWACCKLRKKRQHGGVPYQELEMALPGSFSATDVETAEGWDQDWDDDWDDDNAVKTPGGHHVASISSNGLTSRSANREGWESNWDD